MKTFLYVSIFLFIFFLVIGGILFVAQQKGMVKLDFLDTFFSHFFPQKEIPVKIHLKYGGTMNGLLLEETDNEYILNWKGSEFVLAKDQVLRIKKEGEMADWPYNNDIVIKLKSGAILDGIISNITKDRLVFQYEQKKGSAEMEIQQKDIEYLLFAPVHNSLSQKIEKKLKRKFSKMKFYKEGDVTIITDSYATWVKAYQKTVRTVYSQIYLKFFKLFSGKKQTVQNFVVIFDNYKEFVDFAIEDGVPGWAVLGYYKPEDHVLYLFNVLGDKFAKFIEKNFIGKVERVIDSQVKQIKKRIQQSDHMMLEGQAHDIKDRYWRIYNLIIDSCKDETLSTLRHEFIHELFNNWGLQNVKVSRSEKAKAKLRNKKKEAFEFKSSEKKQAWLSSILGSSSKRDDMELKAANSWLVEGLATYGETYPIGNQNDRWLFIMQEMIRNNKVYPLATLTFYKMGSFPGMYSTKAMITAYAQSWALVTFLLEKYPDQFVKYMQGSSDEAARADSEDLQFLLKCLGKDAHTLDQEFLEYINAKYEKLEDPFIKGELFIRNLFKDLK
ncbi:hypothetical protein ACFLQ1_00480 [Candidatus Auribacterota bacterium]